MVYSLNPYHTVVSVLQVKTKIRYQNFYQQKEKKHYLRTNSLPKDYFFRHFVQIWFLLCLISASFGTTVHNNWQIRKLKFFSFLLYLRACEVTQDGVKVHVVNEYVYSFSIEKTSAKLATVHHRKMGVLPHQIQCWQSNIRIHINTSHVYRLNKDIQGNGHMLKNFPFHWLHTDVDTLNDC